MWMFCARAYCYILIAKTLKLPHSPQKVDNIECAS